MPASCSSTYAWFSACSASLAVYLQDSDASMAASPTADSPLFIWVSPIQ